MGNCLSSKYAVVPGGYRTKKSSVQRLKRHNYVTVGNYLKIYLKETKIDLTVEVITSHNYPRSFIFFWFLSISHVIHELLPLVLIPVWQTSCLSI